MTAVVPDGVQKFISEHVSSIGDLEVLLLLHRQPERWFSAEAVANELHIPPSAARASLEAHASGRLLDARTAETVLFRYHPLSDVAASLVAEMAQLYEDRSVAITTLIYSKPSDAIRGFADAFRIWKRNDDR